MLTVIIPTIYKSPHLIKLLRVLENCDLVQEVILIEDDVSKDNTINNTWFNKLTIIPFTEKRWFNGCINLGVSLVKTQYYAISNDDVVFPSSIIKDCMHHYKLRPKTGVIGMHSTCYHQQPPSLFALAQQNDIISQVGGWGMLMFNHKNNDIIIPNDLKHYFGDNYMIQYSKYPCYTYYGDKFYTTSDDWSTSVHINDIFKEDGEVYNKKYLRDTPMWETINPQLKTK
jgi:hypothetical protein